MIKNLKPASGTQSQAKLEANRRNAQKSTGPSPSGRLRTRFNAVKYGVTRRVPLVGRDPRQDERAFARAWERLGPRNAIEEVIVHNLWNTRLRDGWLLDAEKAIFERRPVLQQDSEDAYPFLFNAKALDALILLARQVTHFTRNFNRDVEDLLKERKEQRGAQSEGVAVEAPNAHLGAEPKPEHAASVNSVELEAFLREQRPILRGDNVLDYEALAQSLWNYYQRANLLEEFITTDLIDTYWRLARAERMQAVLLKKSAVSASGEDCGLGFGFLHDCQRNQGLEALRIYECGLRNRAKLRRSLFCKLREGAGRNAAEPTPQHAAEMPSRATPAKSVAPVSSAGPSEPDSISLSDPATSAIPNCLHSDSATTSPITCLPAPDKSQSLREKIKMQNEPNFFAFSNSVGIETTPGQKANVSPEPPQLGLEGDAVGTNDKPGSQGS